MSVELTAAIISATVSVISILIGLIIGLKNIKIESEKLRTERERLQSELRENAQNIKIWKAENARLKAETDKLVAEASEIRRKKLEAERAEIRDLLLLFERQVFDPRTYGGDPTYLFIAFRQTRIELQTRGASLIHDKIAVQHFREIRDYLLTLENKMRKNYPDVAELAEQLGSHILGSERMRMILDVIGKEAYYQIAAEMRALSDPIFHHVNAIRERLATFDEGA